MRRVYFYIPVLIVSMAAVLFLSVGCAEEGTETDAAVVERREERAENRLSIVYPEWTSETASSHLFQAVLEERLGYRVRLISVPVEEMWSRVASGDADILTGAWLPVTHRDYYNEYADRLEDLGPNLTGARIGLVVPVSTPGRQTGSTGKTGRELVTVRSIEGLAADAEKFRGRIVGIESGSGVVARTVDALDVYGLESRYHLVETTEERMLKQVADAIHREKWIVFTGWKPHWVFEMHNLRFLEDPKEIYGGEESIHTMVRTGFAEEHPDAYEVLSRISYETEDLERLMRWIHEDEMNDPYGQALRWIDVHEETVDSWVAGIE